MKDKIKKIWQGLTPEKKKKVLLLAIVAVIGIAGIIGYQASRGKSQQQVKPQEKKELKFDSSVMEKSIYSETQKEIDKVKAELDALKREKEEKAKQEAEKAKLPEKPSDKGQIPPLPPLPPAPPSQANLPEVQKEPVKHVVSTEKIGEIAVFSGKIESPMPSREASSTSPVEDKKKDTGIIYLPPSFMEATLLSGLDAPTAEGGKGSPVPVLLRIKDLAILPNKVKANLKGCFVIAEGYGDLATERANLRLTTLSCVGKKGESVIDQPIKGFVVDSDGKIGLKGNVVSKMGAAIARSAIAGFFGGLGQAIQQAYTNTSVSLAGTTTSVAPENVTKVAAGQGLSQATQDLKKFYLDLARQALPVVEVGATKIVTLVISEGVELRIRNLTTGDHETTSKESPSGGKPKAESRQVPKSDQSVQQQLPQQTLPQKGKGGK